MDKQINQFVERVWEYYDNHARELPWRTPETDGTFDPYKIMVSEVMLQQTQVRRVTPKYIEFLERFPTLSVLANATFTDVLKIWSGLGYNRRAKFLLETARIVASEYNGNFPNSQAELTKMPGIGSNTAAAIMVYAFNKPCVFIETNIRTVFIYEFFKNKTEVSDNELWPLIEKTLDKENPREWFWALMDYGAFIKSTYGNASRYSKHYKKQSQFKGSRRQLRAAILRQLLSGPATPNKIRSQTLDHRTDAVLDELQKEDLILYKNKHYQLV